MNDDLLYDLLVVGAGPGGATTALFAARAGLRVLVVDKDPFPRDKICGDAISGKSVDVLARLGLLDAIKHAPALDSWGILFAGPYGTEAPIGFSKDFERPYAPGYLMDRLRYDALLFDAVAAEPGVEVWSPASVTGLLREGDRVVGAEVKRDGETVPVRARVTVGADGAYSVVARALGFDQLDERHYCAGLRQYYEGVTGFQPNGFIELHFLEEAIPGYFWVFPMAEGRANVGIGMLSSEIKRRDLKLKETFQRCLDHPKFRERFADARPLEKPRGWGLPLGSKPRPLHGDGWLLVGDAASLIDPFSGEGIGNAMISGEIAARYAAKAREAGRATPDVLAGYRRDVKAYLGAELRISHLLQKLGRWKGLLNLVIGKAQRSPHVAGAISAMFDDENQRKKLLSPLFYLRLLFA